MRKTKIVCTVGPSTDDREILKNLMLSGMNVARFNFSHGDYGTHKRRFEAEKRRRSLGRLRVRELEIDALFEDLLTLYLACYAFDCHGCVSFLG